jgi:hypothetical protein
MVWRREAPTRPPLVVIALSGGLAATAVLQALAGSWRPSTFVAAVVAGLLWIGHRRARFAAYIFFSVVAVRGGLARDWLPVLLAAGAVGLLQTPAARRHSSPIRRRARDRMPGP